MGVGKVNLSLLTLSVTFSAGTEGGSDWMELQERMGLLYESDGSKAVRTLMLYIEDFCQIFFLHFHSVVLSAHPGIKILHKCIY
ncbi:hypothetical protein XELAEV_18033437mg [Xenopus laevis]|uniref:Uncharacterized protein n=1 Tax=Xenopus laevis TaxID=8355 RepID=A0A974CJX7_XENLA|nr:hypothetical protein XELAEV_18033437mg [Xenopus laevis]